MLAGYVLFRDGKHVAGGRDILLAHDLAKEASADGGSPIAIEGPGILRGREVIAVYENGRLVLKGRGRKSIQRGVILAKARAAMAGSIGA